MRIWKHFIICLFCFLAIQCVSYAEMIDHTSNRHAYAQVVSELNRNSVLSSAKRLRVAKQTDPVYTLILFRTLEPVRDWAEHQPEVLVAGPHGCYTAAYNSQEDAVRAVEYLKALSGMLYAELDAEVHSCATGTQEPIVFHSHGASQMGFEAATIWAYKAGTGSVTIAVIDSGIYPHPALSGRLVQSGYDYVDGDDDATSDAYGHGTHVAGVIADCTPGLLIRLKPIRVLNALGKGSISNTVSAIYEAAEDDIAILNMSLVSDTHSEALEDAVTYAVGGGAAIVISAGNNGELTGRYCPVHMDTTGLIVVGACTGTMDELAQASYSNYGSSVDVYAFGNSIESCSISGGYSVQSGTSQAAPHISALCAILKLLFPSLDGSQMETRVKRLAGDGEINVPDASQLKPLTLGLTAKSLTLPAGTEIMLLQNPYPKLSGLTLRWSCEDASVASVDANGILRCLSPGITVLHADGSANADAEAILKVVPANEQLVLPVSLLSLEEEALAGTVASALRLPAEIENVNQSALSGSRIQTLLYSGTSISVPFSEQGLCWVVPYDSALLASMDERGIPYLANVTFLH